MKVIFFATLLAVFASFALANSLILSRGTSVTLTYRITLNAAPSADGTVSGAGIFATGTSQTVTATPNGGFTFVNWTENSIVVSTSASYTFTLTANRTLVANFTAGSALFLPNYNNVSTNWAKAGLAVIGGIPTRSTNCATLTPSGGDDLSQIQSAIDACPAGQVVKLNAGTFNITMSEFILLDKGITLRGTGTCNNGSSPYCQTVINVSNGELPTYVSNGQCGTDVSHIVPCVSNSVILMLPTGQYEQAWSGCVFSVSATGCSTALDADGAQGDSTIRVHSLANLSVGGWVRLDELSGAVTQTDPSNSGCGTLSPPGCGVFAAPDFTASSGSPATGKIAYAGAGVEDGAGYGSLYDRETSEIHLISAVGAGPCPGTGCTVTFDSPLTVAFRTNHSAQIYWSTRQNGTPVPFLSQAGVENISISRATHGPITMVFCAYCWVDHVEAYGWMTGITLSNTARSEIVNSYIHDCYDCENNGVEYPIAIDGGDTENLVSNNIIRITGKGMVGRSCGGGNVVSYNYQDDTMYMAQVIGNYWHDLGLNASHYVGCHHTLLEGNYGDNCDNDETHGNTVYHTFFRNWCVGLRSTFNDPSFSTSTSITFNTANEVVDDSLNKGFATGFAYPYSGGTGPQRAGAMMRWAYWMAFVGNVLGKSGVTTPGNGWTYQSNIMSNHTIWMIGWSAGECSGCSDNNLNGTTGTYLFRHGNYDYLNNAIVDYQTGYSHTLSSSLYLTSAPASFTGASCTYPWPWVTADAGSPIQSNSCSGSGLPALARWNAGTPFVQP